MTETKEQRRERLAQIAKRIIETTYPGPSAASMYHRIADYIVASDEAAGLVVVPVEPTDLMIRACADIDTTFPPGAADAKKYYRAMIAATKE